MFDKLIDIVGFYAPLILVIIVIILQWNQQRYLFLYLLFLMFNFQINKLLKLIIRDPRPISSSKLLEMDFYKNEEKYGMPSGHAQLSMYSTIYIFLINKSQYIFLFSLLLSLLSILQRFKNKLHNEMQLIIGSIIGIIIALVSYNFSNYLIKNNYI